MSEIIVAIKGEPQKMSFALKVFRTLGRVWNLETLPEVMQKVALIEQIESGRLEIYDVLFEVLFYSIDCHPENSGKITIEDIENLSVDELVAMADSMAKGISEAFFQPVNEKKVRAPKK